MPFRSTSISLTLTVYVKKELKLVEKNNYRHSEKSLIIVENSNNGFVKLIYIIKLLINDRFVKKGQNIKIVKHSVLIEFDINTPDINSRIECS